MEREVRLTKEEIRAGKTAPGGWYKIIVTREGVMLYFYKETE